MKSGFQFWKDIDGLDYDSPVPIKPDKDGRFEAPVPGHGNEVRANTRQTAWLHNACSAEENPVAILFSVIF